MTQYFYLTYLLPVQFCQLIRPFIVFVYVCVAFPLHYSVGSSIAPNCHVFFASLIWNESSAFHFSFTTLTLLKNVVPSKVECSSFWV